MPIPRFAGSAASIPARFRSRTPPRDTSVRGETLGRGVLRVKLLQGLRNTPPPTPELEGTGEECIEMKLLQPRSLQRRPDRRRP
eukprot:gene16367-biopygen4606